MKKALAAIALIGLAATSVALPSQAMDNALAQVETPEEAENVSQEEDTPEAKERRQGPPSFVQNLMPQHALKQVPDWFFG